MFVTLTNVQRGEAVALQRYIDNRCGIKRIAIRSFTFWIGWHNLGAREWISWRHRDGQANTLDLVPGLYNFELLSEALAEPIPDLTIAVGKATGVLNLSVPQSYQILLSEGLKKLLGLDDAGWLTEGSYLGDRPISFMPQDSLFVHLDQLSTSANLSNGAPSTLLGVFPAPNESFGEAKTFTPPHPEYKNLSDGTIDELKVRVTDSYQKLVDNHGLPIAVTLEIQ